MGQREHERYLVELPVRLAVDSVGTVIVYNPGAGGCKIVRVNWMSLGCSLLSGRATMAAGYHPKGGRRVEPAYRIPASVLWHERIEMERACRVLRRLVTAAA